LRPFEFTGLNRLSGFAYQFRTVDSPVHQLDTKFKLTIWIVMSVATFAVREPWAIAGLLLVNIMYYLLARLGLIEFWKDIRFFLIQMFIIVGLYVIRYGIEDGVWPGIRTTLQILLFFMPGMVFLRTTQSTQIMRDLKRILPVRFSFLIVTSLRFIPFFARELHEISMAQQLRGARLTPRQFINPRSWKDFLNCLMVPLIIRALKTSNEAALSAEARAFDKRFIRK
jgi:energy-coupling factor transporter transmembrane protein EcfT